LQQPVSKKDNFIPTLILIILYHAITACWTLSGSRAHDHNEDHEKISITLPIPVHSLLWFYPLCQICSNLGSRI